MRDLHDLLIAGRMLGGSGADEPVLITKNITANGTYSAADDNADGYSAVTVAVPEPGDEYVQAGLKYCDYGDPFIFLRNGSAQDGMLLVNPALGMTVEMCMRLADYQAPGGQTQESQDIYLFDFGNFSNTGFFTLRTQRNTTTNQRYFSIRIGNTNTWQTSAAGLVTKYFDFSEEYGTVAVSQSINENGKFKLYINGVKTADATFTSSQAVPFTVTSFDRAAVFMAGDGSNGTASYLPYYRVNQITKRGSMRVYNRVLTDAEIAANFAVDNQLFN